MILKTEFSLLLKKYAPQTNPKIFLYNTAFSAQIPGLARHSLLGVGIYMQYISYMHMLGSHTLNAVNRKP